MTDDWGIEPSALHRSTRAAMIGAPITCSRGDEIWSYGVEQQQSALGTRIPEADSNALHAR
jgi:hypothetical protein